MARRDLRQVSFADGLVNQRAGRCRLQSHAFGQTVCGGTTRSPDRSHRALAAAFSLPVVADGAVPGELDLERATLAGLGFDGKIGQTLVVPRREGPSLVAVGIGVQAELDTKVRLARGALDPSCFNAP